MKKLAQKYNAFMTDQMQENLSGVGLLILRLFIGGMMAFAHGLPKLMSYGEKSGGFPDPLGVSSPVSLALAIFSELFCSLLIMAGVATRLASTQLIFTMIVAAFLVHGADPFSTKELALVYLIPFITLFLTGPGKFSVDHLIKTKLSDD